MKKIVFFAVALLGGAAFAAEPAVVKKEGGSGFRFDDNRTVKMWQEMADIFNKYNFPLMYAINTGGTRNLSAEQQACLQKLVKEGHEIMDHTLEHRVFKMSVPDPAKYANEPWVDHISGQNIYIKYIFRNDTPPRYASQKIKVDIAGDQVTLPPELHKKFQGTTLLKYQGKAYLVMADKKNPGVFQLKTFWGEPVNLGAVKGAVAETVSKNFGFSIPPEALKTMGKIVAERFEAMKLPRPTAWIQPGSPEAIIQADNVRQGLAECGYISAATYQNSAFKVFCESEPERCAYAMMWGQLHLGNPKKTVEILKSQIADAYACHQVLFASSHMTDHRLPGGWQAFLQKHDELLKWCREKAIPVRTQSQWAKLLYYSKTDPAQNVFPQWTVDLDENKRPDGYKMGAGVTVNDKGELVAPQKGEAFSIIQLGGVEKGKNLLSFQVKSGTLRCTVSCIKRFKNLKTVVFTGSEKELDIPAEADFVRITVWNTGDGPLVLAGASLKQQ